AAFPEDHNLKLDLANLLYVNNRHAEAKKILEEIAARNSDSPFANLMLYEIYRKENKNAQADKELEKAFLSPQLNIDAKI
ncbi:tetratricopeptide repeat protein, partial [Klebsiella pneumoniae]|nr:tetratricopeptide repeat protein [Klebsiella pneumoniae]